MLRTASRVDANQPRLLEHADTKNQTDEGTEH